MMAFHRARNGIVLVSLAALGSMGGCPLIDSADLEASAEQLQLVGRTGNSLILGQADFPSAAFSLDSLARATPPQGVLHTVRVNLDTLEVTPLADRSTDDEAANSEFGDGLRYGALSSDAWSAEPDYDTGGIVVRNVGSGVASRYLGEHADAGYFELGALDGDRLAVTAVRRNGGDGLLLVIDLNNGQVTAIGPVISGDGTRAVALVGNQLAYWRPPGHDGDGALAGFFAPPALELVNLETDERTRVATARGSHAELRVEFAAGRIVWSDWTSQVLNVSSYDPVEGTTLALASIATGGGENSYTELRDFNGLAMLLSRVDTSGTPASPADAFNLRQRVVVTLHFYDGRETTLLDRSESVSFSAGVPAVAVLTDRYAVVSDADADELIAYDLVSGETKRIRPFGN
ncbi:MAG: hypothetical protein AB7Q17_08955 [Phycisphaerae bacterium]